MPDSHQPKPGTIGWVDLTVDNAETVKDFYSAVVGWRPEAVRMNGYSDFSMVPPDSETPATGICHARGANAELPRSWLVYFTVADLDRAMTNCLSLGGSVIVEPRRAGSGRYCVIKDPAGAVAALYMHDPASAQ